MAELNKMYEGVVNSPATYLREPLASGGSIIYVIDGSVLGELPNLAVIGNDQTAETVLVKNIRSDGGYDVDRAVEGNAKDWSQMTTVARNFTNYDYEQIRQNFEILNGVATTTTNGLISIANGSSQQYSKLVDGGNCDDITEAYVVGRGTNFPQSGIFCYINTVFNHNGTSKIQYGRTLGGSQINKLYTRTFTSGTWSAWTRVANLDDIKTIVTKDYIKALGFVEFIYISQEAYDALSPEQKSDRTVKYEIV